MARYAPYKGLTRRTKPLAQGQFTCPEQIKSSGFPQAHAPAGELTWCGQKEKEYVMQGRGRSAVPASTYEGLTRRIACQIWNDVKTGGRGPYGPRPLFGRVQMRTNPNPPCIFWGGDTAADVALSLVFVQDCLHLQIEGLIERRQAVLEVLVNRGLAGYRTSEPRRTVALFSIM